MKNNADQVFDEYAETYKKIHDENLAISGESSEYFSEYKIREMSDILRCDDFRILDFGCGIGASEEFFEKYFPLSKIIGIDVSPKSILKAKEKQLKDADFEVFDGKTIPFEDNTFDIVFTACVFHHIDFANHIACLGEILRVLKKGGDFFLFEHNPLNPVTRKIVNDCVFDKDARLLPFKYTKNLLEEAGFKDIRLKFTVFFPRFLNFLRSCEKFMAWLPVGGQYYFRSKK